MSTTNTPPTTRRIKCRVENFDRYLRGERHFEIRSDDRAYNKGDILVLMEFEPCRMCDGRGRVEAASYTRCACMGTPTRQGRYTGRSVQVTVTHVVVLNSAQTGPHPPRVIGVTQPEARFSDEQVRTWCVAYDVHGLDLERARQAMQAARLQWPAQVRIDVTKEQTHE